jgi:hypothetical protein
MPITLILNGEQPMVSAELFLMVAFLIPFANHDQ